MRSYPTTDVEIVESVTGLNEAPKVTVTSPKYKTPFIIEKEESGFIFYRVRLEKGAVPKPLTGNYTSMQAGVDAVVKFISTAKETNGARTEYFRENRAKRNKDK